jgi:hypothetical protein
MFSSDPRMFHDGCFARVSNNEFDAAAHETSVMQPRGEAAQMELRRERERRYQREYPVPTRAIDLDAERSYYGLRLRCGLAWCRSTSGSAARPVPPPRSRR